MALLIATFMTTILGCGARLTLTPNNVAVLQGAEVTMKCGSDPVRRLLWRTLWNDSAGYRTIYSGNKIDSGFLSLYRISVIKEGEVHLIIIKANEATAKTYVCEEYGSGGANASAELIVLASDPKCDEENPKNNIGVTEQLPLQIVCRVHYWGNWAPVMEWKRVSSIGSDGNTSTWIKKGVFNKSENNSVESTISVTGSQHLNGTGYVCITYFTQSQRASSASANNTPAYSYTWNYPVQRTTRSSLDAEFTSVTDYTSSTVATDSSDVNYTSSTVATDSSDVKHLRFMLFFIIPCILLPILMCITFKKTNKGCISEYVIPRGERDQDETNANVAANGVADVRQIIDEDQNYDYPQVGPSVGDLELCPEATGTKHLVQLHQENEPPRYTRYIGDDGTEYMEMNGFQRQLTTVPQIHPSMHDPTVYAKIDHTLSPPPPPNY